MKTTMKKMTTIKFTLLAVFAGLFLTASAQAAPFTVDRTDNANISTCSAAAGDCTLRGAITAANAAATDDVIDFDPAVFNMATAIALSAGNLLPNIANNGTLTINGPTANRVTVSGNSLVRVFIIDTGATFEVNNLTVANGLSGTAGGGILNNGTLTITNCTLDNNKTNQNGGAIANYGTLTITNSTLSNNQAIGSGGAIVNFAIGTNTITINNSTLSDNSAGSFGGGLSTGNITVTLNNSTISRNSANSGGGINSSGGGGTLIIISTTISNNSATTAGGGLNSINVGTITLNNSIIANSTSGGDCRRTIGSSVNATYSLIEENLNCVNGTNSNNLTGDPNLEALGDNGGPTYTHELLAGSIAIDKGNSTLTTDQRGSFRPVNDPNSTNGTGNLADIGAFEVQAPTAASVSINGRVLVSKGRGLQNAILIMTDANGETRTARTNPYGYYRFYDVAAGQTVIMTVVSKRFQFAPQMVYITEDLSDLNFVSESSNLQLK